VPAGRDERDNERGHAYEGLDRPHKPEGSTGHGGIEQAAARGTGLKGRLAGRLGPERDRRKGIGTDIEGEDLEHAQGQRKTSARQRPYEERRQLGDVVGEVVGEKAPHVGEDRASLLDGGDDRGEVIVQEHEIGSLARHVGPGTAHRDADVRLLQRGAIVHAVAGHGEDVTPTT
jgi:hypothetical protein